MDPEDLLYNAFYHSLRNEFRKKYESAISKCWTICVPSENTLRRLMITENFVDDHILKPHSELAQHFTSTGAGDSFLYKFNGSLLELINHDGDQLSSKSAQHKVKVVSNERGYNKEFQMYLILILDKPLHPKYILTNELLEDEIKLNLNITSYKEAVNFFNQLSDRAKCPLDKLESTLSKMDLDNFKSSEDLSSTLQELTRHYWATIMRKHTLHLQRDSRFQKLLSTAIEVFILHFLHGKIYSLLSSVLHDEDSYVNKKLVELINAGITPDQLGAHESLAISLPAAIVELATLDAREGPLEKLLCLGSTLDLIVAEVKAALAEVQTKAEGISGDAVCIVPSSPNLIPFLMYVIIKSRPRRLVTDLHYIQNFLWSVSPQDGLSHSLVSFEAAVSALFRIQVLDLPHRSYKVKTELPIGELFNVISKSGENFTPIDRQIHQLATMLEKCTQD